MKNDPVRNDVYVFTVLAQRKIRELCLGKPFLAMLFVQQMVFFFFQRDALLALDRDGILVAFHPAQYGLLVSVVLLGIFLLLYAAAEPARERESGALETLFYGPVSELIYVSAVMASIVTAMAISLLTLLGALWAGVLFIGYEIPVSLLPLLPVTLLCFWCISAAGIFISILFRQARLTMTVVTILLVFSLAVTTANFWFSQTDFSGSFAMIFLRQAVSALSMCLNFIFPLGLYFDDLSWFIGYGRIPLFHVLWYLLYAAGLFLLSVKALGKRGVLAR